MIYHFNSIFTGKNIGEYYNKCCSIVPDKAWICLWDADVMTFHTFGDINALLERAIAENPHCELFSCVANRIGTHKQRVHANQCTNPSMRYHRVKAEEYYNRFGSMVRKDSPTVSGLMMLFNKETWEQVGKFPEDGMIGIDTRFSKAISQQGYEVGILQGLYVMHYYRLMEENSNHLK